MNTYLIHLTKYLSKETFSFWRNTLLLKDLYSKKIHD